MKISGETQNFNVSNNQARDKLKKDDSVNVTGRQTKQWRSQPDNLDPAMQIPKYYHY